MAIRHKGRAMEMPGEIGNSGDKGIPREFGVE